METPDCIYVEAQTKTRVVEFLDKPTLLIQDIIALSSLKKLLINGISLCVNFMGDSELCE